MNRYKLFQPLNSKLAVPNAFPERFNMTALSMPEAERGGERESVWLAECTFRAGTKGIDDLAAALHKIQDNRQDLAQWVQQQKEARGLPPVLRGL
jgi:hypothetical protein